MTLSASASALALGVLQLNLEQLTALSEQVFVGRCVSVQQQKDNSGRPIQVVTFEVEEMLKGNSAKTITFRQIGYVSSEKLGDAEASGIFREMPQYEIGEEAVIFLSAPSRLGLTAPVGLFQGKFDVTTDSFGVKQVVNGIGNRGLFMGWKGAEKNLSTSQGNISYQDFISLVKKLTAIR